MTKHRYLNDGADQVVFTTATPFSWDGPKSIPMRQIPMGHVIMSTMVSILEPFDDPQATLLVGDAGKPDLFAGTPPIDLTKVDQILNLSGEMPPVNIDPITLLDPKGAKQGFGVVVISYFNLIP